MTADVVQAAVDELRYWLPRNHAHIATPDQDGSHTRGKPGTKPPGNWGALAFEIDVAAELRHLEATMCQRQGLPVRHRGGSNRNTGLALARIGQLSHTADHQTNRDIGHIIHRRAIAIRQQPANDDAPRWHRIQAPCPYCRFPMIYIAPRPGLVACMRGGASGGCRDTDGNPPMGEMGRSELDGDGHVYWRDGLVT